MTTECLPISSLPGISAIFRDYAESGALTGARPTGADAATDARDMALLRRCYPSDPFSYHWAKAAPELPQEHREKLVAELLRQAEAHNAGESAKVAIGKLRDGAAAVVTGQQVGLFGGPLLSLLKAATAIRKAQEATRISGREHVAIFWLATEDHDLAEVDMVDLPTKTEIEEIKLGLKVERPVPVGNIRVDSVGQDALDAAIDHASELIAWGPVAELLRECYAAEGATLASAFARLLASIFAEFGLILIDAASREVHALGASTLRSAIEQVDTLDAALLQRTKELEGAGYHAQVLVTPGHSLLFLIDENGARLPLRRVKAEDGTTQWKAGMRLYTTADLLAILEASPERLSPNALLRAVMQDTILPTSAYVGGPAEIAYFAQSAVVYKAILGRVTAVLPRLSATLISPEIGKLLDLHEVSFEQVVAARTIDDLALRLGARAMPIEGKRKIAAVGNAMDTELNALTEYMTAMSADLGRTAGISANKMRYQMDRLRRMAARFELEKETSLRKHATAMMLELFPEGHLQERLLGGIWALSKFGEALPELLVQNASQECPGHRVIRF
ncbi:bacillithiol biosynthesis cysteine-adding enzyme BshC [Bryocella elongata]|uniref:Putative cysteine ligase BshC n=1 Tax=Bryocella elongata TaxID=863522 RepID=A0A1H5ZN91_9BACT|nr:bacillithiol biosynthesis cysteine-adding enzyme BshC [Bryocella elongata]SEG37672.1 bacillithiol biosynthesis cysteine-adding enzyme BshC [Bryocella elongata]